MVTRDQIGAQMQIVGDLRRKAVAMMPEGQQMRIGCEKASFIVGFADPSIKTELQAEIEKLDAMIAGYRPATRMTRREWNHEEE